jgi:hypothetical protein
MLSRDRLTFFMAALWAPLLLLVSIFTSDFVGGRYSKLDSDYSEWMYVLWRGIPGYVFFAFWTTQTLTGRSEPEVLRMVWLAPLKYIPFYAVPWIIFALGHVFTGHSVSSAMTLGWLFVLPFLLVAGYVFAGLTVALYRTVFS